MRFPDTDILTGMVAGEEIALVGCSRSGLEDGTGLVPCLHGLSVHELFRIYDSGIRRIVTSSTDCENCGIRKGITTLTSRVEMMNELLCSRGLDLIDLVPVHDAVWRRTRKRLEQTSPVDIRRRSFLFGTGKVRTRKLPSDEDPLTLYRALPASNDEVALYAFVPQINTSECNGCDACINLCPHHALEVSHAQPGMRYFIHAQRCTGCSLCVDLCEENAVRVAPVMPAGQKEIWLTEQDCPACGNRFHVPADRPHAELCPVCAGNSNSQKLYQVYS